MNFTFVPVTCGAAFKNKGVQTLLDAVVDYLPSPLDVPPIKGIKPGKEEIEVERKADDNAPFSLPRLQDHGRPVRRLDHLLPHLFGQARIAARRCINSTRDRKERVGRMLLMHANSREDVKEAYHRRHRRPGGAEGNAHRRHAVRSAASGHP